MATSHRQDDRKVREVFISLGRQLSEAASPRDAALATLLAADELIGWDAAFVDHLLEAEGVVRALAAMDVIDGERQELPPWTYPIEPGGIVDQVLEQGPHLIRRSPERMAANGPCFGDHSRLSATLMFVPVLVAGRLLGLLSVQSYTFDAYTDDDLELLVALAEFCGGALARTTAEAERARAVEALAREHSLLRGLINALPDHIYVKDAESRFVINNAAHLEFLGVGSQEETVGKSDLVFFSPEQAARFVADEQQVIRTGVPLLWREEAVVGPNGITRWNATSKVPWRDADGKIIGTFGISRDITERKLAEEQLFRSTALYQAVLDASEDYIFVLDRELRMISANGVAARRYGTPVTDRLGKTYYELLADRERAEFYLAPARRVLETGQPVRYEDSALVGGQRIFTETQLSPVFDRDGHVEAVLGVSRDITERKKLEEELRNLSLVDALTGLYNRRGFQALAEQQLRIAARTGGDLLLVFADLDGLKQINDTWGHQEGDAALVAAARVLSDVFRQSDVIARMGGDEFTVLAACEPGLTDESVAARICAGVVEFNAARSHPWMLSISFGIAHLSRDGCRSLDDLLTRADEALYSQKRAKRS